MIGSYGSGSCRPHTEDELEKARQALALLRAHKERGETAAQKIGAYILGGNAPAQPDRFKKANITAYEPKTKPGSIKQSNNNYRKVFNPTDDEETENTEEEKHFTGNTFGKQSSLPHSTSKGRLEKVNNKFNGGIPNEPKTMSNLANLGKKALNPVGDIVSNEFGIKPAIKNQVKKPEYAPKPPLQKYSSHASKKPPMPVSKPKYEPQNENPDEDRPIKPASKRNIYEEAEDEEQKEMPEEEPGLSPTGECRYCGRKFNPESLAKHQKVCQDRPDKKKRKKFDSKAARLVAEEQKKLQAENAMSIKKPPAKGPAKKVPKWKQQSQQFRNAMKAVAGDDENNGPTTYVPAPPEEDTSRTQCPTCGRSFNEEAAKRHIPFCANKAKLDAIKMGGKNKGIPPKGGKRNY